MERKCSWGLLEARFPPSIIFRLGGGKRTLQFGCNLGYLFLCRKDKEVISRLCQFTIAEFIGGYNGPRSNCIYLCETSR